MLILGIETTCDDTSVAILNNAKVLVQITTTNVSEYQTYGGIIPEIAARNHCINLDANVKQALINAKISLSQINLIAYASTPGLPGCLHVGKMYAKTLSYLSKKPLLAINHLHGHIFSYGIEKKHQYQFPCLGLVVSGGNTAIYLLKSFKKIIVLNTTSDEAVGEALDKIGRALSLPYPGGVSIDRLYQKDQYTPLIKHLDPSTPFSFSGIRAKCQNIINKKPNLTKLDQIVIGSNALS
jgi:N6-L-threonylcarbamoyladenine synthase